ncbi:hypothetical protein [Bacillus sp. FJAT-45350]|uniref:hypothetical protein n=1 Tax=Bacillus sp. FJAT-45350 TaxID=2011014 RepID=UPI000BB891CE|nr:hypothetical protein [Bacillus sp. FJAT-45350]
MSRRRNSENISIVLGAFAGGVIVTLGARLLSEKQGMKVHKINNLIQDKAVDFTKMSTEMGSEWIMNLVDEVEKKGT